MTFPSNHLAPPVARLETTRFRLVRCAQLPDLWTSDIRRRYRHSLNGIAQVGRKRSGNVSLQVAIVKVLASYPDGRATVASINCDLAILAGAGPGWTERLKRLAARVPDLDIFGQGMVTRDDAGWQLTDAGRDVLHVMEAPVPDMQCAAVPRLGIVPEAERPLSPLRIVRLKDRSRRRRRPVADSNSLNLHHVAAPHGRDH